MISILRLRYAAISLNLSLFSPDDEGEMYNGIVPQLVPFSVGVLVKTADIANS